MAHTPKNLVVISFGAIGDALMLLALLDAVHESYPSRALRFFTARQGMLPKTLGKEYEFVQFSDLKTLRGIVAALSLVFTRNLVLVPPSFGTIPSHIKLFALALTRMPGSRSVGFKDKSDFNPYDTTLHYDNTALFYENLRQALAAAHHQIETGGPRYRAHPERKLFSRLSLTGKKYVVIHPFAANPKRGLPKRRWKTLVANIANTYPTLTILLTGGKRDADAARDIAGSTARSLAGELSLSETAALVKDAALYVGVDTGVTHLASLLRVPSVIIANRSNPSWLPSYNPKARILSKDGPCGCTGDKQGACSVMEEGQEYFRCAYDITDKAIMTAAGELLSAREAG